LLSPQIAKPSPNSLLAVTLARAATVLLALAMATLAEGPLPRPANQNVVVSTRPILEDYRFSSVSARTRLPKHLREVSGLVALDGTRVALHTDNSALIWTFDYATQQLDTKLRVSQPIPGDFEGIAQVGTHLLLADSHGSISRFKQPFKPVQPVRTLYHPQFKGHCVFEGLALVTQTNNQAESLLVPCKYPRFEAAGLAVAEDNLIYIFRQPLGAKREPNTAAGFSVLKIDVTKILRERYLPRLRPSAIEVVNDRLLILAGKERILLETSLSGELIAWRRLHWPRHRQAEGLTMGADGALIIADEGRWRGGTVTVYQPSTAVLKR